MVRLLPYLLLAGLLAACGGGGGGSSDPEPPPPPEPQADTLALLDAIPAGEVTNADPGPGLVNFAHLGHSDLTFTFEGDCAQLSGVTVRRRLLDLAAADFDALFDHRVSCNPGENSSHTLAANGVRANDARFRATHSFATGTGGGSGITVLDQRTLPRDTVDDLFASYIRGALLSEIDLSPVAELLLLGLVLELSADVWEHLADPDALYDVATRRVSYPSRQPGGAPTTDTTGVIAMPLAAAAPDFSPRDRMLVLTHATGSTPGDLEETDAWYILANLFAARGYLVIAPDNYGRGGAGRDPETYLMATRTAANAFDMLRQVLADPDYDEVYSGGDVTIIGYSQGAHSAVALWQMLETQAVAAVRVREVYAGGGPHNLYQTFRGVLQHLDGSCDGGDYCRYVDADTTVQFATERILPGFIDYTDTGLMLAELVDNNGLDGNFITGFLANEAGYDNLKALLQLSSFTNVTSVAENLGDSDTLVHLYHSDFDRLVPRANTSELAAVLSPHVTVDFHENRCNSDGYEIIFNLTDRVGVIHTLCGLAVLDEAMEDLR